MWGEGLERAALTTSRILAVPRIVSVANRGWTLFNGTSPSAAMPFSKSSRAEPSGPDPIHSCITVQQPDARVQSLQSDIVRDLAALWIAKEIAVFFSTSLSAHKIGLLCEAGRSLSQRLHTVLTSDLRVGAVESICLASKDQLLNLMKVEAALNHCSSPCAPHHVETR